MGRRELVAWLCLSSWCLVIAVWLFLTMPRVCLQFVIVVFQDHTHLLFLLVPQKTVYLGLFFQTSSLKIRDKELEFTIYRSDVVLMCLSEVFEEKNI